MIEEARQLQPNELEKLRAVSERIQRLCEDDLGQDILMAQVSDKVSLKALNR